MTRARSVSCPDLIVKFQRFSSSKWLRKHAKCYPTGVKMAIFAENLQKSPSGSDPVCVTLKLLSALS